jgi:hypothetical protein
MLSTAGVLFTHPFGILLLPTLPLALFLFSPKGEIQIRGPRLRLFLGGLGVVGFIYLPLLYRLLREFGLKLEGGSAGAWLPDPGWTAPLDTFVRYFMSPWLAALVLGLVLAVSLILAIKEHATRPFLAFATGVGVVFMGIPWMVSLTITPLYYHRYTIPVLPLLLLLLGLSVSRFPARARLLAAALILALSAAPVVAYHTKVDKTPFKEAFQALSVSLSPGDLLIRDPGWLSPLTLYYFRPAPGVHQLSPYLITDLAEPLKAAREVWVITWDDGYVGVDSLLRTGEVPGWTRLSRESLIGKAQRNPRALSFQEMFISHFRRIAPDANPTSASADGGQPTGFRTRWARLQRIEFSSGSNTPEIPRESGRTRRGSDPVPLLER